MEEFDLAKLLGQRYFNRTATKSVHMEHFAASAKAPKSIPEDLKVLIASRNQLDQVNVHA